ncbi:integration host factor, actinobacterial type [Janibacter limosus]|uniref:integration host factor, actinobacterial type n=1 Tax=Janibacter limosus TaxID=53458 RepID=UPI001FE18417|nr:integration host factor, actinobacterial type [Janibacter limosus]
MVAPVPTLSPQQRTDALARATAARRARAELRQGLKSRAIGLAEVLEAGRTDPVVARMRVTTVVESMPGVGPATAVRIMQELGIAASRRIRGLGPHQRTALLERFTRV